MYRTRGHVRTAVHYSVSLEFLPHVTMVRSTRPSLPCSARGRAELRAGAAVVAIGVGSPVARLGQMGGGGGKRAGRSLFGRWSIFGVPRSKSEARANVLPNLARRSGSTHGRTSGIWGPHPQNPIVSRTRYFHAGGSSLMRLPSRYSNETGGGEAGVA